MDSDDKVVPMVKEADRGNTRQLPASQEIILTVVEREAIRGIISEENSLQSSYQRLMARKQAVLKELLTVRSLDENSDITVTNLESGTAQVLPRDPSGSGSSSVREVGS
jgi:hypothetical protein